MLKTQVQLSEVGGVGLYCIDQPVTALIRQTALNQSEKKKWRVHYDEEFFQGMQALKSNEYIYFSVENNKKREDKQIDATIYNRTAR